MIAKFEYVNLPLVQDVYQNDKSHLMSLYVQSTSLKCKRDKVVGSQENWDMK